MKKIGLIVKEQSERFISGKIKESSACFIIKYSGLSSPDMCTLRQNLGNQDVKLFVAKNSVARRALKSAGFENLCAKVDGPSGLIFIKDEPVNASRLLCDFAKTHAHLKIEGGFLNDRALEKIDIEAMSKLPTKDVLRAQVVMTLNSPISGLVITLNQVLKKFIYCLDQIKTKKGN